MRFGWSGASALEIEIDLFTVLGITVCDQDSLRNLCVVRQSGFRSNGLLRSKSRVSFTRSRCSLRIGVSCAGRSWQEVNNPEYVVWIDILG